MHKSVPGYCVDIFDHLNPNYFSSKYFNFTQNLKSHEVPSGYPKEFQTFVSKIAVVNDAAGRTVKLVQETLQAT